MGKSMEEHVIGFVRKELDEYNNGLRKKISTDYEIANRMRCSSACVCLYLNNHEELLDQRAEILKVKKVRVSISKILMRELSDYQEGRIERYTSIYELKNVIAGQKKAITYQLTPSLRKMRKKSAGRKEITVAEISRDYAWFLGALAGDGCSSYNRPTNQRSRLILTVKESSFRDQFAEIGEQLFGIEAKLGKQVISDRNKMWNDVYSATFNSVELVDLLGDFRSEQWPDTVKERHDWILSERDYLWGFLGGYFDAEGSISNPVIEKRDDQIKSKQVCHRLRYAIAYRDVAAFVMELLRLVDLGSSIEKSNEKREGIGGIAVYGIENLNRFATNVHSTIPEKERRLDMYRNAEFETGPSERVIEAYHTVLELRELTGLGARRLNKLPELEEYGLNDSTIRNWVNNGNDPRRNGGFYSHVKFPSVEEN
jgi:hypothetical protein